MIRQVIPGSLLVFIMGSFIFLTLQLEILGFLFTPITSSRTKHRHHEFPFEHWRVSIVASSTSTPSDGSVEDHADDSRKKKKNFLSAEQLEQVKSTVDIVSVVEAYKLPKFSRKSDQSAIAVCPFHDDHSPSLSVDNNRKIFKCFACGEGGDVFKFVRAYSALKGREMTFFESVRHVANTWGDPTLELHAPSSLHILESDEERQARADHLSRILLCNAAAARFYGKALTRLATAGPARTHLRSRGLSPATVRAFALGFAPDSYFESTVWGEGSLVLHLRTFGFSASEIVQAGLAVETKRPRWKDIPLEEGTEVDEFEDLMDRFRGRVIVPIFDETGSNVIAFGGRVIAVPGRNKTTDFKPPKYINSPESILFSKKQQLFGLHIAKDAVTKMGDKRLADGVHNRGSLVIVEGYMDVIALYDNSVQNVVASMGTALTLEQLSKAAKVAGTMGGCIVLCFDNDEAGITAVERLCSSQFLAKTCADHIVEVRVAELPDNVKDPGEFFEAQLGNGKDFEKQILEPAKDWTTWYMHRLLSRYDEKAIPGGPGSFASICDHVSDFLATFPNPADRTKRAFEVAAHLSRAISGSSRSRGFSNALQIQLESDLVTMVARKAAVKETLQRRVETVEGHETNTMTVKRMLEGGISQSAIESSKIAGNATEDKGGWLSGPRKSRWTAQSGSTTPRRRRARINRRSNSRESLTPHFTGISIAKETDAEWLGVPHGNSFQQLRGLAFGITESDKSKRPVLFNSNDYHGDQYLTADAFNAGYTKGNIKRDSDIREKGIGILIREDHGMRVRGAEERLLRAIVQYPAARAAMRAALSSSDATGTNLDIDFSSEERAWLFNFLVFRMMEIDCKERNTGEVRELWEFLRTQDDVPVGAFGSNPFGDQMIGTLASTAGGTDRKSSPLSTSQGERLSEVDAQIVLPIYPHDVENETFSSRSQIPNVDVERWSEFYDSSIINDVKASRNESALCDFVSAEETGLDEARSEAHENIGDTAIDARLEDKNAGDRLSGHKGNDSSLGILDVFFVSDEERYTADTLIDEHQRSYRSELDVQEALAYLLRASAAKKLDDASSNWLLASRLLNTRLGKEMGESGDVIIGVEALDAMNIGDLKQYCESLVTRLKQLWDTVNQLGESAQRISSRLMEISNGDSSEGRLSITKQQQVCREVEAFVDEIPEDWVPAEAEDLNLLDPMYVLSLYQQPGSPNSDGERNPNPVSMDKGYNGDAEKEQFRRDMLAIDEVWGGMAKDDYVWSMPDEHDLSRQSMPLYLNGHNILDSDQFGEDEALDETLARIDRDWGDWDDESIWRSNERERYDAYSVEQRQQQTIWREDLDTEWE